MKNLMKAAMVVLLLAGSVMSQEKSQSEIKRDFETRFVLLTKNLNSADNEASLTQMLKDVTAFEEEFKPQREFLNKAVFPDGYDGLIDRLKKSKELAEKKIRASQLEKEIASLNGQVQSLKEENATLRAQLTKAQAELASLKKTIATLQDEIQKRDEAVFALVDSLFVKYDTDQITGTDMKKLSVLEKKNVVASIRRSVTDNMMFLSSASFSAAQVPQLLNEQRRFEASWSGIGGKLAKAYVPSSQQGKEIAEIAALIGSWHALTDSAFWKGLNEVFAEQKLPIVPFNSGEQMAANIGKFIDDEIANTAQRTDVDRKALYESFAYNTWGSKVKPAWVPVMVRHDLFSEAQMAAIDVKVKAWSESLKPAQSDSMSYVLIALLVVAVAVGVYLGTRKRTA